MTQQIEQQKSDADILAEAREYIEKNGWCQGHNKDANGSVCAFGAVVFSQQWNDEDNDCKSTFQARCISVLKKVVKVLGLEQPARKGSVPGLITNWNDEDEREEQEVLDAFMKAEKLERGGNVREE